jgi:DNA-binding CsgD family transcriptional regulator
MTAVISDSSREARGPTSPAERPAERVAALGREEGRQIVGNLLRRAQRGAGGVVLVDGEPGIGKTLLLRESVDAAAERGFSLAAAAADQVGSAIPFFTLRTALREPFTAPSDEEPGHDDPDMSAWPTRARTLLEQRAANAPVLVALDDLHWASPGTMAALRALPTDLRRRPIVWLLARTAGSAPAADHLFGLLEKDGAVRVTLGPLDHDAVVAMLSRALGGTPDQAMEDLARTAAGNPGLVTELIAGLREEQGVNVSGGRAVLASSGLPQRVRRLAQKRLSGLSPLGRQLLVTAAMLGPGFRLEDAAEMLGETPATLLPAVEETLNAAIIAAADHTFAFRHELLRRAIGELIPRPARTALHHQYGEILLARGEPADQAATHLLLAAHRSDRPSLARLDQAAERTRTAAPQVTADLTTRALELTPSADRAALPRAVAAVEALTAAGRLDQAARIADDLLARPLPTAAEYRLRCAISAVASAAGRPREAAEQAQLVLAQADLPADLRDLALTAHLQALCSPCDGRCEGQCDGPCDGRCDEQAGQAADAVLAAPGRHDDHVATAALITRALVTWESGRVGDGLELLRHAARQDTGISLDARHSQPLLMLAAALIDLRELDEAKGLLRAAASPVPRNIPADAALCLLRGRVHLVAGRLAEATADAQAALAAAAALGAHGYAATGHSLLAAINLRRGDIAAAAGHVAARPVADPQFPDLYAYPEVVTVQARIIEARDGAVAALGHLRQLCAGLPSRAGFLARDPALPAWLARAALAAGDTDLAARVAEAARSLAQAHPGHPAMAAAAAHCQGIASQDPACLSDAARRYPDPWARASAAEDLGVLHRTWDHRDQAVHALEEALAGYREAQADRDQARVRRRLRMLGVRARHWSAGTAGPLTGWDSLTRAEQAVARLVAQGLNNKQVGARLYISEHTVAHHLRQAFRKLSIASRVELARIVIERTADAA